MVINNVSIPVVVMKTEHYGGLGIMRSLGRLGVRMFAIDRSAYAPALRSRYCRESFVWDIEHHSAEETMKLLRSVVFRTGPFPILIPTSDETMLFVANHAQTLKQWFTFPEQPVDLINALYNKKEMYSLAKKYGIPVPQTSFPLSVDDVAEFSRTASFPLLVKGIDGKELEKRTGKKMVIVNSKNELMEKYLQMENSRTPNIMIQEYIPGSEDDTWIFNGYFNHYSAPLALFSGKKTRQNPIYTGMTSLGITCHNETVIALAVRFMQAVEFRGVVDIDFRYDARDGNYKILDVNPRVGATFRLFVGRNGMDVVRAMYLDLTHQRVYPTVQREKRKWIVEDKDLLSSYRYYKDGKLSVWQWIQSVWGIEESGYFAMDDIKPFVTMWMNHIRRRAGRIFRKKENTPVLDQTENVTPPSERTGREIPHGMAQENA